MSASEEPSAGVNLADEPDFALGGLDVRPSACRVGDRRVEPRVMEVLVVLVRHAGRTVARDRLIDACWGGRIVSDDAVTRVVAQVRGLARELDPPPFTLETVPKVGFRLVPADAPVASEQVPGDTATGAPPSRGRPRRGLLIVAGLALLVAAAVATWRFALPHGGSAPGQNGQVEVMAFQSLRPDPDVRRIADELPEATVRVLATNGVPTSEHPLPRGDAGHGAEFRIAGSVDREGDNYVVNAQILERGSGLVLWSSRFERPVGSPMRPSAELGGTVAAILICALEDRKGARTPLSTEAFGLYVNACASVGEGFHWDRMLTTARRLVRAAPDFADAHAMRAIAAANVANESDHLADGGAALRAESGAAAERALELNPRAAKAYAAKALNIGPGPHWAAVENYTLQALKLDPELPVARAIYTGILRETGRLNEAIEVLAATNGAANARFGVIGDPRVAMMLAAKGDLERAEEEIERLESQLQTDMTDIRWTIAVWWEPPASALRKLPQLSKDKSPATVACFDQYLRRLADGGVPLRGLPPICSAPVDNLWRVRMLAREGDLDGAYAAWTAASQVGQLTPLIFYYPEMKAFRADPRFLPLVTRLGLLDYWRGSGHPPDFCTEPDPPPVCDAMRRPS